MGKNGQNGTPKNLHFGREEILELLGDARALQKGYARANRENPRDWYFYPLSIDHLAAELLERRYGVIFTGASMSRDKLNISARYGSLTSDGEVLYAEPTTLTLSLDGFKESTTVGRFAASLCDLLTHRANNGNPELKSIMATDHVQRTLHTMQTYHLDNLLHQPYAVAVQSSSAAAEPRA